MSRTPPGPAWIASAALTVLAAAAVAAATLLSAAPAATGTPAQQQTSAGRVVAAFRTAPVPLPVPVQVRVQVAVPAAAAPRPAAAAARPVAAARTSNPLCEGPGWQQRRGEAVLNRLRRPADARAVAVAFRPARPDVLGLAHLRERRVDVFVRSCARQSDTRLLHVLAHELGHILDATRLDSDLRDQWMAARGIPPGTPWFGCDGCTDFATPAGDFAEAYAQWQRGATTNKSQMAPAPSRTQLASLAARFFAPL